MADLLCIEMGDARAVAFQSLKNSSDSRISASSGTNKARGTTSRFVYLPYESHGRSARESVLAVLAEMFEWFDKYVKNKKN